MKIKRAFSFLAIPIVLSAVTIATAGVGVAGELGFCCCNGAQPGQHYRDGPQGPPACDLWCFAPKNNCTSGWECLYINEDIEFYHGSCCGGCG